MVQAVSRPSSTAEARVRPYASQCGIYAGQSGTGAGFSPRSLHSTSKPCSFISHRQYTISVSGIVVKQHTHMNNQA